MTGPTTDSAPRSTLPVARPSIALALGGGGARGLAHILMLEVFDELGLVPKVIAGTSIGAIFGAAYASGLSAKLIRAHAEESLGRRLDLARILIGARAEPMLKILQFLPWRAALLSPELLLDSVFPSRVARHFGELQIPLKIVATDFYAQEQVVIESGLLRPAVAASMAIPALFAPVARPRNQLLVDGGLVNPLPFDLLHGLADIVVAIDVSGASMGPGRQSQPTALEALMSSSQILQRSIVREKLKAEQPDIYIDVDVDAFHVLGFNRFREILAAAEPAKQQLRRQLLRVLSSQTAEALPVPAAEAVEAVAEPPRRRRLPRLKRLPSLKRLTRERTK